MLQWDWFLSTWYAFFPPMVEFPHSILRMKFLSPGMNHRPKSWCSAGNILHRELSCEGNLVLHKGVDTISTKKRKSHWSWLVQWHRFKWDCARIAAATKWKKAKRNELKAGTVVALSNTSVYSRYFYWGPCSCYVCAKGWSLCLK